MTTARHAEAQVPPTQAQRIDELALRLHETQATLAQTQAELNAMRAQGCPPTWFNDTNVRPLPPVGPAHPSTACTPPQGIGNQLASYCEPTGDGCSDVCRPVCPGLPPICGSCKELLSWNKGDFRITPYGAVYGEMISSENTISLRGSPLFLVPGPAPGINDSRFTVSGQQSIVGLNVTGPNLGSLRSSANVAANFFGEQPIQNNPGLFFLIAYAELANDQWRWWIGQAADAIGRQNTNSPAWTSHKMQGNFGQLRPGFRAERYFRHSPLAASAVYFGLTQQAVNDFIALPGVSGIDNGWPNVEGRWEVTLGREQQGQRPLLLAVGGLIGETRAVDDLAMSGANVSTTWAVIPELRLEGERWGFQGEAFVGQAMGTYNGAIGQSLNPADGEPIYAVGAFGEIFCKLNPCFTVSIGAGVDDPRDADLGMINNNLGQRSRNEAYWGNFIWRLSDAWETRFEVSHLETTYLAPSNDSDSMLYHMLVSFGF